jgi:cobyrinic acid a,c-diamide synthase
MLNAQFLIAAPVSGSGKTTLARGLMALFRQKGYRVQPFKCGPDYIDTKFHEAACGRPSINLDSFMASEQHLRHLFAHYSADADISIVEGMMGLFDGYDRDRGSSAQIARILQLPIVLVVDAGSAAYSMAALLSGFVNFQKDLHFAGIIFNRVGSARHRAMLQQVCDDLHVRCLGFLPRQTQLEQPSRYLGLDFSASADSETLVRLLDGNVAWKEILSVECRVDSVEFATAAQDNSSQNHAAVANSQFSTLNSQLTHAAVANSKLYTLNSTLKLPKLDGHLLVARNDESFSFVYQEHVDRFERVTFFDPEHDVPTFSDVDLLYLPGGYPEKHLDALVAARDTRQAIARYAAQGGRILAECGGMMYLCQSIDTDEGAHPMCGVLPYRISARRQDRRLSLGYRQFSMNGLTLRGHEFHYTQFADKTVPPSVVQVFNAQGMPVSTPVFRQGNVVASYTHLYWGECDIMKIFKEMKSEE